MRRPKDDCLETAAAQVAAADADVGVPSVRLRTGCARFDFDALRVRLANNKVMSAADEADDGIIHRIAGAAQRAGRDQSSV